MWNNENASATEGSFFHQTDDPYGTPRNNGRSLRKMTDDSPSLAPDLPPELPEMRKLVEISIRLAQARALHDEGLVRELEVMQAWLRRPPSQAKH